MTYFWVGATNGDWNNAANWSAFSGGAGGAGVPGVGDTAVFDGSYTGTAACTADATINVTGVDVQATYDSVFDYDTQDVTIGIGGFLVAGGTVNFGSGAIDINGDVSITGGAVNGETSTVNFSEDWNDTGSRFDPGASHCIFDHGTAANKTCSDGAVFYDLTMQASTASRLTVAGGETITIQNDFNMISCERFPSSGTALVGGNISGALLTNAGGRLKLNGTGAQILQADGAGGSARFGGIEIDKASGLVTIKDNIIIRGGGGLEFTNIPGGVNVDNWLSLTTDADGQVQTFNTGVVILPDVTWNHGQRTEVTGSVIIGGTFTKNNIQRINGGTVDCRGDIDIDGVTTSVGTGTLQWSGSSSSTYDATGQEDQMKNNFVVSGSGALTLASALTMGETAQALTQTGGVFDLNGKSLSVDGALTVQSGATLQLEGGETITAGSKDFQAGSLTKYDGASIYTTIAAGYAPANVEFGGTGEYRMSSPLDADAITITGSAELKAQANQINCSGNWNNTATFTHGGNTVVFDGAGQQILGTTTFNAITKTVAAADTFTLDHTGAQTFEGTLTLNGADGQLLSIRSTSTGVQAQIDNQGGAVVTYLDVQDSQNVGTSIDASDGTSQQPVGNNSGWNFGAARAATIPNADNEYWTPNEYALKG